MEEKKLTGYPSIDKPWLKYYSEEAINAKLPECTVYDYLWEQNKDYLKNPALRYFERRITFEELKIHARPYEQAEQNKDLCHDGFR